MALGDTFEEKGGRSSGGRGASDHSTDYLEGQREGREAAQEEPRRQHSSEKVSAGPMGRPGAKVTQERNPWVSQDGACLVSLPGPGGLGAAWGRVALTPIRRRTQRSTRGQWSVD